MRSFRLRNPDLFLTAVFTALVFCGFAQTTEDLNAYKAKYPGQHIVMKQNTFVTTIKMVKDVPVVHHHRHLEHLVLDKNGVISLSEESLEFSSFEIMDDITAYSLLPNGKSSKKVPATNFATRDAETSGSVFHDDSKETSFIYPNLAEGSLRVLDYSQQMTLNAFPFGFNFYSYIPMERAEFIIECDTAIHLLTKVFNGDKARLDYTERVEKNKRIYTWKLESSMILKDEELAPASRYYAPHVLAQISYYNSKKGRVNVTGSPQDLHNRYKDNVAEVVNEQPSAELKAMADSITSGLTSELDKVKAVYYWVQDNIKYIAFEEGMNGYIPRQPSKVISKRYGDCKDMASLIYSMLKSVDVPCYLTWIGSRDLPYKYTEFPSSSCDNHMISVYKGADQLYFLDATSSFQTFNYPTGFIQGKQAMMHLSPTEFEIIDVPVPAADRTMHIDTAYISIDNKSISGRSKCFDSGYYHILLGDLLRDVSDKDIDKALQSLNQKGNNSFQVKNGKLEYLHNRDQTMVTSYDFMVNNYVTSFENETYVNMILEKDVAFAGEMKEGRIAPFEMENKSHDSYTVILDVPQGYKVKSIPKNASYKTDFMAYSVTYTQEENRIIMNLQFRIDFLILYPDQFAQWNEFIRIKKASVGEAVVLTKN